MDTRQIEKCVRMYWNIEGTENSFFSCYSGRGSIALFWIIINSEHMVDIKPDPKSSEETEGLDLLKDDHPDLG